MNVKKSRSTIIVVVSLIALIVITSWLILPFFSTWTRQSQEIRMVKASLKKRQAIVQRHDELEEKFSDINNRIQARLPGTRGESTFLNAIGQVAKKTNVHIETMNPRPFRDLGFFRELSVEIDMQANLGNLVRFLYEMRKSSVVLVANNLKLKPKSERSALLNGYLVISTIFLKEQ